jgi:hypothetical protein
MAVPNGTCVKLKKPGPCGVISISSFLQCAYQCKVESCKLASAVIASEELAAIREETTEGAPDSNRATGSFEPAEGMKEVIIDPKNSVDFLRVALRSLPNRKARSSTSFAPLRISSCGNPRIYRAY